jgi:hypothetical protein
VRLRGRAWVSVGLRAKVMVRGAVRVRVLRVLVRARVAEVEEGERWVE